MSLLYWSGRRDSNPRPPPWQGDVLPLNYFRSTFTSIAKHHSIASTFSEKIKKIDVLADELETEITASMQTCLIRFGEIVQIQNAMIQKMHALSDEIFQLRAQAGLENVICRASGQQEAPKGWDEADPSIPEP